MTAEYPGEPDVEYPDDVAAVVYDLDGTLVRLDVDWDAVAVDLETIYEESGVPIEGDGVWQLVERAHENGLAEPVEATLSEHERAGAPTSSRLPVADDLVSLDVPAGVCSLNCEAACRIALETHGLDPYVDAVVGRDTVNARKPDPEPLLATIERLGCDPAGALFVGDSEADEIAAERAGVRFSYVGDGPTRY